MKIYNTLTKQKEELIPGKDGKIRMFVCGPTVYDYIHIGNARTFVIFDTFAKYLRYKYGNKNVEYIVNITDIDNKIIDRAKHENADALEYARKYTEIFKQDMDALGVTSPEYKNATDHIPEVIQQVQTLIDKGHGYVIEHDGIYFELSTFPEYGKLSGRTANMANDAVSRIDDSDKKRNRGDFALWKFKQDNEPYWPAPFGEGRPGWHIEDTAITQEYFGPQYDIHGGGQDLIFPHHEAEIAQQESASGLQPFVKYWVHIGFLVNKSAKMSKSLGNFLTLNQALKKHSRETLRFYLLSNHYRSPLDFSDESFASAAAGVERIHELIAHLFKIENVSSNSSLNIRLDEVIGEIKEKMDDDFNTPAVFAVIFDFVRIVNKELANNNVGLPLAQDIQNFFYWINDIFGIISQENDDIPEDVRELINRREIARQKKDFTTSDQLRKQLKNLSYEVEDTIYGPLIKKVS